MSDQKKPGAADLDDLRSRLGIGSGPGLGGGAPSGSPAPGGDIPPPAFGPAATPPPGGAAPATDDPDAATTEYQTPAQETPAPAADVAPPPAAITPPPAAAATPSPASSKPVDVAPPAFGAAPGSQTPAPAGPGAVPPPSFSPAAANVAPPPFAAAEEEEEEEIVREVVVKKIVNDGEVVADKEVGRISLGPYVAIGATIVLSAVFGTVCGSQIDRAVRANRAIDSANAIHESLVRDQELLKNLKSRISGAARKALHKTEPGPDFELLDYLGSVKGQPPFTAKQWSGEFYQAFRSAPLLFEYYRGMNSLWDLVDEVAERQNDPSNRAALKSWPSYRENVLKLNSTDGSSGWGVAFKKSGADMLAVIGTFKGSRRERVSGKTVWQSSFTPLGGSGEATKTEYQPGFEELSENPEEYFVRVNPDIILGPKRQLITYGGPLVAEFQDPYLRYLMDVNALSKSVATIQSTQDNLIQTLGEIRQERRVLSFGF